MTGSAGQKRVPTHFLASLSLPLPSLAEQRRIAEVLDSAEALRAKRREAITQLNTLTRSIFLDMFGDPATNPKRWPTHPLGDVVAEVQIGPFGSLMHQSDYVDGGIPLVNPMHIVDGKIVVNAAQAVRPEKAQSLTRYWLREGDIVIGRRGEMGRCAVVGKIETGMICGSGSAIIRPDVKQARPTFLQALLSTSAIKALLERKALGVTMLNLNSVIIADVVVMLPPMGLQMAYERMVQMLETITQASVTSLTDLDALFVSLQHRAFRGEL
jgi:type I restriction enzyme, S subunit